MKQSYGVDCLLCTWHPYLQAAPFACRSSVMVDSNTEEVTGSKKATGPLVHLGKHLLVRPTGQQ